ncbi:MAG: DUF5985 family protein [Usitatibacter sp.]
MVQTIYLLCALTSAICAAMLLLAYQRTRSKMLLWSALCFVGFTLNNALVLLDRVVFAAADLSTARLATAFLSLALLLFGLIWESE